MKAIYLLSFLTLTLSNSFSQNLNCIDFKNGTFIVESDSAANIAYKIIRNNNVQVETVSNPEFSQTIYVNIEWIDECGYKAIYEVSKMELTQFQKFINDNGGILTEFISFDDRCANIKSTLTVDGEPDTIESKICLE